MLKKRIAAFAMALMLALSGAAAVGPAGEGENADPAAVQQEPVKSADGTALSLFGSEIMLMCAENGQVLAERSADEPVAPASITKLMTALLVLESGRDLGETLTVSYDACHSLEPGSTHIALDTDEEVTIEQMLHALLITSANDAANVLAEAIGGTQEDFARMMTERAAQLGCQNTHFVNAHGLDDPQHYTTARDMALIMRELLRYEEVQEICCTPVYTIEPTNKQDEARELWNKQCLLRKNSKFFYPDAIVSKNGWTTNAGQTLVCAARRGEVTLIAVTMGADENKYDKIRDSHTLFDYGFDAFDKVIVSSEEQREAVEQALRAVDTRALVNQPVLVPKGSDYMLRVDAEGIAVFSEDRELIQFSIPDAPLAVPEEEGDMAPVEVAVDKETEDDATGTQKLLRTVILAAVVVLLLFLLFAINRWRRVRRQRARIRAMRERAARQREIRSKTTFYDDLDHFE